MSREDRPMANAYDAILDWWSELDDDVRASELDEFAMEFAYHSAKVERATITYEDAQQVYEEDEVTDYTGDVRSLISIINQREAFRWMLRNLKRMRPLDEEFTLRMHHILTHDTFSKNQLADRERPGKYKLSNYFVRETREVGASVEDSPRLTRELLDEVGAVLPHLTPDQALITAAYFHNTLVTIHPFSEGTGRVAREIANYILLMGHHPPIIVFEEDKPEYFATLEIFDDTGDLEPFKAFLRKETVKTWENRVR